MSRGRSERKEKSNFEVDHFRRDPFQEMHQVMRQFGSFGRDDFFGGSLFGPMRDPFEEMMDFSKAHRGLHGAGKEGSYICQTFVSSSKMGQDGKMKQESYFENSAGQNRNGQTISQKHQAYKNSDGIKRIAEERMLNDRGHKIMKEKRGEQVQQSNHYYNMDEHESDRFAQDWRAANQNMKFLENVERMQKSLGNGAYQPNRQRQLGNEPRREEPRQLPMQESVRGSNRQESRGSESQKGSTFKESNSRRF